MHQAVSFSLRGYFSELQSPMKKIKLVDGSPFSAEGQFFGTKFPVKSYKIHMPTFKGKFKIFYLADKKLSAT